MRCRISKTPWSQKGRWGLYYSLAKKVSSQVGLLWSWGRGSRERFCKGLEGGRNLGYVDAGFSCSLDFKSMVGSMLVIW